MGVKLGRDRSGWELDGWGDGAAADLAAGVEGPVALVEGLGELGEVHRPLVDAEELWDGAESVG